MVPLVQALVLLARDLALDRYPLFILVHASLPVRQNCFTFNLFHYFIITPPLVSGEGLIPWSSVSISSSNFPLVPLPPPMFLPRRCFSWPSIVSGLYSFPIKSTRCLDGFPGLSVWCFISARFGPRLRPQVDI
ncbi:hypothetical protein BD779DRAFT_1680940 [Infundibulicybe gibba]|nr:hypothetical protein BD779DRAFT_1680940 [Infundibulicybe gibba]